jgi:hypothetical protein
MASELSNKELAELIVKAQQQGLSDVVADFEREIQRRQNDTFGAAATDIVKEKAKRSVEIFSEPIDYRDLTTGFVGKGARIGGGQIIGGAAEIAGEGLERSGVLETAPFKKAEEFFDYLGSTDLGQEFSRAFDKGMEALQEWGKRGEANARLLEIAGGFLNIGIQAPGRSVLPRLKGQQVEDFGSWIRGGAEKRATKNRKQSLTQFFAPDRSKVNADDVIETGRVFKRRVWNPKDPLTSDALDYAVEKLPNLKSGSAFKARDILEQNLTRVENRLITGLRKSNVVLNPEDVIKELQLELADQFNTKQWKDKAEAVAARDLFDIAVDRIQTGDKSLESLLLLRRELDKTFGKKGQFYTGDQTKIGAASLQTLRKKLNEIIDREAVDVDVSSLLKEQSYSLRLKDHLEPKIKAYTDSWLSSLSKKVSPFISQTGPGLAATVSIGAGAVTALTQSPTALSAMLGAGAGVSAFGAGYLLSRPAGYKMLGRTLEATGKAIKAAEKTGATALVAELKADRLLLIDLMQRVTVVSEEQKQPAQQAPTTPPQAATQQTGQAAQIAGTIQNLRGFNQLPPQQVNARLGQLNDPMLQQAVMQQLYGTTP